LVQAGFRVPNGFCITVEAYDRFVAANDLKATIRMELGRKPLAEMRWEEIWDSALRIRSLFLAAPMPTAVADPIIAAARDLGAPTLAVRSSAPGEDAADQSHAGLHESLVGVGGEQELLAAVRIVWSSLWSDAALLYRKELGIDVLRSRMAVVVQEFVAADLSGVGFGIDPRYPDKDREMVEAVPGFCEDLVSGAVDPDRWIMKRSNGEIVEWTPGARDGGAASPLLERNDLDLLHRTLHQVENLLGCPPDVEWTGRSPQLTLLQARPVTSVITSADDERSWYLSLRPNQNRLDALCTRVTEELIPALEAEGQRFAAVDLEALDDTALAEAIEERSDSLARWKVIYKDEFIPFAHGVRRLGMYYNDAVRPDDPYEFTGILGHQPMLASERNTALAQLAAIVRKNRPLARELGRLTAAGGIQNRDRWRQQAESLPASAAAREFHHAFEAFLDRYMNIAFDDESLDDRPDLVLGVIVEMAHGEEPQKKPGGDDSARLERRLLEAVGPNRQEEALKIIRIGRLSWQLRDDDNILMGRLENQLQHALHLAADRLVRSGRLDSGGRIGAAAARVLADSLRNPTGGKVKLPVPAEPARKHEQPALSVAPRQMIGQPAAPGLATGSVRIVREAADFSLFRSGEIMVCDAIQPTMTHLVPLAGAIVERRGGMLIHGAIIARELGVPCVNGVANATGLLRNGDLATVDGYLGIVTVGPPEFDLEREQGAETDARG
jgi:pyruvate,water dikinase